LEQPPETGRSSLEKERPDFADKFQIFERLQLAEIENLSALRQPAVAALMRAGVEHVNFGDAIRCGFGARKILRHSLTVARDPDGPTPITAR
jgi:hypothetical protein